MQYITNEKGKRLFAVVPIKEWNYIQELKKKFEFLNVEKTLDEVKK